MSFPSRVLILAAAGLVATAAAAQTASGQSASGQNASGQTASAQSVDSAAVVNALADCRAVRDDRARLACFDAAAGRLLAAERAGEIVVVDREQVRTARRQAFGFNLPSLDLFRRGRGDDRGAPVEEPIERVSLVLAGARQDASGKWVMRTEDGQVWRQTDDLRLFRSPGRGSKADVRKAALGSFFMNVDGQKAIRVRREQ